MEGKGWFAIYGLLAVFAIYLFIVQRGQAGQIASLQQQLSQSQVTPEPSGQPSESPEPATSASPDEPDLSSPAARDAKRKADMATLKGALTAYQKENKTYPNDIASLATKYTEEIPKDPLDPKYSYRYQKTQTGFRLTAVIERKDDADDKRSDGRADRVYTVTEK